MKRILGVSLAALFGLSAELSVSGAVLKLEVSRLFEESVTEHLRVNADRAAIELETGELFEDDGPAAGHSYQQPRNQEVVTSDVWIKKDLIIPDPEARAAYLVVLSETAFEATINGLAEAFGPNESGRQAYQTYAFDPKILTAGRNQIVLRNSGKVLIARDDEFALGSRTRTHHPNRSAKSTDAGKTWDYDHLGLDGKLDGEYGVRVYLDHYQPWGSMTLPVIDAGNLGERAVGSPIRQVGPIQIAVEADPGPAGQILVRVRSGASCAPSDASWSTWQLLSSHGGTLEKPRGRYVQIALNLSTRDGLQTPRLKSVQLTATPSPAEDWTPRLRVLEEHNEQIVRTSIPFEYEPLDHPRLKKLREEYKLDDIVKGAQTELDLMLRLAQWACNYWDWPNHIMEQYPRWDALDILKPHPDGTPVGGFCQQFNLVFLQACESFGFNGRAVSISQGCLQQQHPGGGHEIVELWSNEWRKWVYVDGALAWYVVDDKTSVPLSISEVRERQLALLRGEPSPAVRVVDAVRTKNKQFQWNGLGPPKPLNWYLELRMIPRSNFLQELSPLPLNQGTEEWAWTGSYVWTDERVPAGLLFSHRVAKRGDFEWSLNQVHYVLEPGETPGSLRVHLDTETPSFASFLAEIDGADKKPVPSGFSWTLHPGKNELRVRPRNVSGREGISSWITLEYR